MVFKLITCHSKGLFTFKNFIIIQITFALNAFLAWTNYLSIMPPEKVKIVSYMFFFPINISFDLFRWLLLLLPFLLIIISFLNKAFKESPIYYLLRVGNLTSWFHSLFIASFLFILTSLVSGFFLTGLIVSFLPSTSDVMINNDSLLIFYSNVENWTYLIHLFFILLFSIFFLILINTSFTFVINNSQIPFLLTIICLLSAFAFGVISPDLVEWYPLTYSLFAFHNFKEVSFIWYYVYLLSHILVFYFFNTIVFKYRKESIIKI